MADYSSLLADAAPSSGGMDYSALLQAPGAASAAQMPWQQRALVGLGGGMSDMARGLQQRGMEFLNYVGDVPDERLAAFKAETAQNRELMQPVTDTTAGSLGYMGGQLAAGAPAAFVPGANTYGGAALLGALYGGAQPTVEGESAALNAGAGAGLGVAGQGLGNLLGAAARRWLAQRTAANQAAQASTAVRDQTVKEALDAGYVLPPSAARPDSTLNSAIEGLGGKIKTTQRAAQKNQTVTNALARQDLGLPPDAPLVEDTFKAVRSAAYQAGYEPIKQAGQITADQPFLTALQDLQQPLNDLATDLPELAAELRPGIDKVVSDLSKGQWDAKNLVYAIRKYRDSASPLFRSADPADQAMAKAKLKAASLLEDLIDRNLAASGNQGMVDAFRSARQQIAKASDFEAAATASGNINAQKLGQMWDKGKPLSGNSELIGRLERTFKGNQLSGNPLQEMTSGTPAFSPLDAAAAALTGDPRLSGLLLGRPFIRELALSKPYQRAFATPKAPGTGLAGLLGGLTGDPLFQHALRMAGPVGLLTNE